MKGEGVACLHDSLFMALEIFLIDESILDSHALKALSFPFFFNEPFCVQINVTAL